MPDRRRSFIQPIPSEPRRTPHTMAQPTRSATPTMHLIGDPADRVLRHRSSVHVLEVRRSHRWSNPLRSTTRRSRRFPSTGAVASWRSAARTWTRCRGAPRWWPARSRWAPSPAARCGNSRRRGPRPDTSHTPGARPSRPQAPLRAPSRSAGWAARSGPPAHPVRRGLHRELIRQFPLIDRIRRGHGIHHVRHDHAVPPSSARRVGQIPINR